MSSIGREQARAIFRDEIEHAWKIVDPIVAASESSDTRLNEYPAGSWGPACADELLTPDEDRWQNPED